MNSLTGCQWHTTSPKGSGHFQGFPPVKPRAARPPLRSDPGSQQDRRAAQPSRSSWVQSPVVWDHLSNRDITHTASSMLLLLVQCCSSPAGFSSQWNLRTLMWLIFLLLLFWVEPESELRTLLWVWCTVTYRVRSDLSCCGDAVDWWGAPRKVPGLIPGFFCCGVCMFSPMEDWKCQN